MMSTKKAVVLLSGGLDSSFNLAAAVADPRISETIVLFIDYGQRAWAAERRAVIALSKHYNVAMEEVDAKWLGRQGGNALTNSEKPLPDIDTADLDRLEIAQETMRAVWVPNRNGVLVNIAAALAEAKNLDFVFVGFNREEAATFPDNSQDYLQSANLALSYSTNSKVVLDSYSIDMDKTEIVARGRELDMPFDLIWSCYEDGTKPCGECEPCRRLARALEGKK